MRNLNELPDNLPVPEDDGACDHLSNMEMPSIRLLSTSNRLLDLAAQTLSPTVFFFYPRTGEPNKPAPADWDLIPGARGCTPQSCGFRDLYTEFKKHGLSIFGISSQSQAYQTEFVNRNHIPFEILSDEKFDLTNELNLPTFTYNSMRLIKRLALFCDQGKIKKVFYPVFPPNKNAETVLEWLKQKT
jgi:peroxiredoxin